MSNTSSVAGPMNVAFHHVLRIKSCLQIRISRESDVTIHEQLAAEITFFFLHVDVPRALLELAAEITFFPALSKLSCQSLELFRRSLGECSRVVTHEAG